MTKEVKNGGCEPRTTMDKEDNLGSHCFQTPQPKANDSAKELGEEEVSSDSIIN